MNGYQLVRQGDMTKGHPGGPGPTTCANPMSQYTYVNNLKVVTVGDSYLPNGHHQSPVVVPNDSTVFIEGKQAAKTGGLLSCGDQILPNTSNVFIN